MTIEEAIKEIREHVGPNDSDAYVSIKAEVQDCPRLNLNSRTLMVYHEGVGHSDIARNIKEAVSLFKARFPRDISDGVNEVESVIHECESPSPVAGNDASQNAIQDGVCVGNPPF